MSVPETRTSVGNNEMNKKIEFRNGKVIDKDSLFIVAEVGNQFAGDMEVTKKLIQATKDAGADAIKFIFWFPDEIMVDKTQPYTYMTSKGPVTEPMYDMLNRFRFSLAQWEEVKGRCEQAGLVMMSTVNSFKGLELAQQIDLPAYKLSSWDYNFWDLWKYVAGEGYPLFIDTGPAYFHEVAEGLKMIEDEGNHDVVLLHCFHTNNLSEMNMRSVPFMASAFDCLSGYSSAGRGSGLDVTVVALGASVLEKRITTDKENAVLHSAVSLDPTEFKEYVNQMRGCKESLGQYRLNPSHADLTERVKWFRHIVADCPIAQGTTITRDMLEAKRGEYGISPKYIEFVVGRTAKHRIDRNETVEWTELA